MLMLEFRANHSCIWGYYLYSYISLTAHNLLVALSNQLKQNDYLRRPPAVNMAAALRLLVKPRRAWQDRHRFNKLFSLSAVGL